MLELIQEKRAVTYGFVARVWMRVALYAVLHDQYVVRIEPRHFTQYHEPIWRLESPALIAAVHAFFASFPPGVLLGIACLLVGWWGSYPRIPDRFVMNGVWVVIVCAEIAAILSGVWVFATGESFLPETAFPEFTLGILMTQTIQLTCYAASALFSLVLLTCIVQKRRRMAGSPE